MRTCDAQESARSTGDVAAVCDHLTAAGAADLDRLAALCPQVEVGRTVGVGHSQMLASPAQVAAMIDRFVSVHAAFLATAPH